MAEFKTAEQYVVNRCEMLEMELDNLKVAHNSEVAELRRELDRTHAELDDAYTILNLFREFIRVYHDSYFGDCVNMETIYGKEHSEEVSLLVEYFDLRPEEDNEDA